MLHECFPKMNSKRKRIEEFMELAAVVLEIKDKHKKSFIKTNSKRIMNMCRALSQAIGKEKKNWREYIPWMDGREQAFP